MKFKNENDLNLVQSYFYKENDYSSSSSSDSLKDDLQYSNYYNEFNNHHNLINTDNMPNNVSNLINNQQSLCSSTNYMLLPKTNNQFESNSSNLVTSTNYFTNRIPLPTELEANSSTFDNESLIRLRNLKERNRVRTVNDGFDRLRKHLPNQFEFKKDKRLSKVQTLKLAITYIKQLENILNSN